MNNPNPFIPQGTLVEQMNKKRARVKMAVLAIFSGTILLIAPVLLIQGCKRDQSAQDSTQDTTQTADTNTLAPTPDTGSLTAAPNTTSAPNATTAANPAPNMAPGAAANTMANNTQTPAMAPAPVSTSEPAPPATTSYVIVAHDTLDSIAKKFNVKLKDLQAANPGVVATKLKVGAPLNIPASASGTSATPSTMASATESSSGDMYTVKSGDNLTKIAKTSGTTVKELMTLNNMTTTRINAGQKLKLPAKSAAASPMETIPATTTTASNPTTSTSAMR